MDETQARAAAEKTIEEFARQEWEVRIQREISHPLDRKEIYLKLVVGDRIFPIREVLPDDFFAGADKRFELSISVQSIGQLTGTHGIRERLLGFLDALLAEMKTTFVLGNVDELAKDLKALSNVANVGCLRPAGLLHIGGRQFLMRNDACSIGCLLPETSIEAIKAEADRASREQPQSV